MIAAPANAPKARIMSTRRNSNMPSSEAATGPKKGWSSTWARDHASSAAKSSVCATTSALG